MVESKARGKYEKAIEIGKSLILPLVVSLLSVLGAGYWARAEVKANAAKILAEARGVDANTEIGLYTGALDFARALRVDLDHLKEAAEELQVRVRALEEENRTLFGRIADLERDNSSLQRENLALRQEIVSLRTEISRLNGIIRGLLGRDAPAQSDVPATP